jgi:hypothetical protein
MRSTLLSLALMLMVVIAASCGGDSDDSADGERQPATTSSDPTGDPDPTTPGNDGSTDPTGDPDETDPDETDPDDTEPDDTEPDQTAPDTTLTDVPTTASGRPDVYQGSADVGGAVDGIDLRDISLNGPFAGCDAIDLDALAEITGRELWQDNVPQNPAASPYRKCTIKDDESNAALFYLTVSPDQDFGDRLFIYSPTVGYETVEGLGDAAGWRDDDDFTSFASLRVDVDGGTMLLAGRYPDGDDYTEASYDDLVRVLHQATTDLTTTSPNTGIGNVQSCGQMPVTDIAGSPVDSFEEFDFDGLLGCVGEAESGDRMAVTMDMWRRNDRYLDNIIEEYEWSNALPDPVAIDGLDDRFEKGVFVDDLLLNSLGGDDTADKVDEVYLVGSEVFINVSVMGQAAVDNSYSPSDLQDVALEVLFDGDDDSLRYLTKYQFTGEGDCGVYTGGFSSETVSCDEPHDFQNYVADELPDGPYPGEAGDVGGFAPCYERFEEVTGTPIGESGLSNYPEWPTESDWEVGYRDLHCIIEFPNQPTGELTDFDLAAGFDGSIPWSATEAGTCVESYGDISNVAVQTTECSGTEAIVVIGLVDPADGDIDEQCTDLAVAEGYDADLAFTETSNILTARGFASALCYQESL